VFVTNAISPAKVQRVSIVDDAEKVMEVIVEDKQLSLAIGKKGQNVRLAAKLTGWKIDIKSEEEKRKEVEAQLGALEIGEGTGEAAAAEETAAESAAETSEVPAADEGAAVAAEATNTDAAAESDAEKAEER
jgi:transcription termination/antitermination protein NusA